VRWDSPAGKVREGVCTNWLQRLCASALPGGRAPDGAAGPELSVFHAPNKFFKLPADPARPVLMVGPGTGVAPFVGFVQHRARLAAAAAAAEATAGQGGAGHTWLFFGCRHPGQDFLYKDELAALEAAGALRLTTAFSRIPGEPKVYVQDRMEAHAAELLDWLLERDAVFYVCGDGARMARDVKAKVAALLVQHRGMAQAEADALLVEWTAQGKYLQDIWS
jgi:sulfite reductase alpha subunit-like flavoprotein